MQKSYHSGRFATQIKDKIGIRANIFSSSARISYQTTIFGYKLA